MRSAIVAELPLGRQHFFRIACGCPKGLLDAKIFSKLFLSFSDGSCSESNVSEARIQAGWNVTTPYRCARKVTIVLLIRVSQYGVETKSRACLLAGASRLKIREARTIVFREQL